MFSVPDKENPFSWRPQLFSLDGFEAEDSVEEVNTQTIIQLLETGEKVPLLLDLPGGPIN